MKKLTLGLMMALAANVALAEEPVSYLDWDPTQKKLVEKACTEYELVTGATTFADGKWYVVADTVVIENGDNITVNGSAHLILCDNASLTIRNVVDLAAAIDVSASGSTTNSLTIYGQQGGSGVLTATGGLAGAGIGGTVGGGGGIVTINGGEVTATGGFGGAGIGGGLSCDGGTVTINGGVVTATGGLQGAGIGGGNGGAGGTVRIKGGTVTATGGGQGAGIGGGNGGAGGTVTINGGEVTVTGGDDAADIGGGKNGAGGTVTLTGGIYGRRPNDDWCASGYCVDDNPAEETQGVYPYAVLRGAVVTICEHVGFAASWTSGGGLTTNRFDGTTFVVPKGTVDVKVIFAVDPAYDLVEEGVMIHDIGTVNEDCAPEIGNLPQLVHRKIEYLDSDGQLQTNDTFEVVTAATAELGNGWYLVEGTVERGGIDVLPGCAAHLILADNGSLTVRGSYETAGIDVRSDETLVIYGQRLGAGRLYAQGGENGAGVGSSSVGMDGVAGGVITINGGTVTATGGYFGAGIGGGYYGAGGVITINDGMVTATGGGQSAGIGGGRNGAGGTVRIKGGAVTATGGADAADIGGGRNGAGGTVTLTGGIYGRRPNDDWCASEYYVDDNPAEETRGDYPYLVWCPVVVAIGEYLNMTAAWTSRGGLETNVIIGTTFAVSKGSTNVKVIFAPEHNYRFADVNETGVRKLDSPLENECKVTPPEVEGIPGTVVDPWNVGETVTAYVTDEGGLIIGGTGAMDDFASAADVPWAAIAGEVTEVTIGEGVTKVGANAFAGFAGNVPVTGLSVTVLNNSVSAEPVIPDDKVLVSKEEIAAAKAETVTVDGGAVTLGVTVNTNGDLSAETKDWKPVELKGENVKVENGKIVITIPVDSQSGFMILQSGDAKIAPAN